MALRDPAHDLLMIPQVVLAEVLLRAPILAEMSERCVYWTCW